MGVVSVVGAGPAGCLAARECAREHDVRIFEDDKTQPVHCTGLVSKSGLEKLGISGGDFVLNSVKGARMFSPSGRVLEIRADSERAYVLDRRLFDGHLQNLAVQAGADLVNEKVLNLEGDTIITSGGSFESDRIIFATGTNYHLQKKCGLAMPKRSLIGVQYDLKVECDPSMVELHLIVPDFFAWVVPAGDYARVGVATGGNPLPVLESFIKKLKKEGRIHGSGSNRISGTIPVYDSSLRTQYGNKMLVGDAAGHVKATTGGGVVLGGIAAKLSAHDDYERRWRTAVGRELYLHLMMRKMLNRFYPKGIDRLFSLVEGHEDMLESQGDMDLISKDISLFMRNPSFAAKFLSNLPLFFIDLLS
ncbi:MAG: geranylgeranyl reductase family protein [Candidatus Altiarchaeota archaeon]